MRHSFTSEAAAEPQGLATGHHYWFGRPRAADLPYNRGLVPAGYLISSAEDMTHYLIAQLNGGRYGTASVLSPAGCASSTGLPFGRRRLARPTAWAGSSAPLNGIPAIHHQGETFNFHANVVLIPQSRKGVVVLMNAENSLDLFTNDRMGTISEGVISLLEGREPSPPPSNIVTFLVYAVLFGVSCSSSRDDQSVVALRRGRVRGGRVGPRLRIGLSLAMSLAWGLSSWCSCRSSWACRFVVAARIPDLASSS